MSTAPVPPRRLWWLVLGFGVWCVALTVLYALHAIGCAFAWPPGPLRLGLALALLAHLAVLGWMWRQLARAGGGPEFGPTSSFLRAAFLWTTIAAFVAAVLAFAPPLLLAACV